MNDGLFMQLVVLNKADICKLEDVQHEEQRLIQSLAEENSNVEIMSMSSVNGEGILEVKYTACDMLLAMRAAKLKGKVLFCTQRAGKLFHMSSKPVMARQVEKDYDALDPKLTRPWSLCNTSR